MSTQKIVTHSANETQEFAAEFAAQILRQKPGKHAVVLALQGDLGAGKTTFLQGFAKGLVIKEKILSPTFVILKKFKITKSQTTNPKSQKNSKFKILNSKFSRFYHIDCYRLKDEKNLEVLGFKEIIANSENIVTIEWPEKIKNILPKNITSIQFNHAEENKRELTIVV